MHSTKEARGGWFHPSVKPPYKRLLCRVAVHPDGCTYYAVWDLLRWLTFASNEQAARTMTLPFEAPFYWSPVRELGYGTSNTSLPPGACWYRVHLTNAPMLGRGAFLHAYWNGSQWSQAFTNIPRKGTRLVFANRKFSWVSI